MAGELLHLDLSAHEDPFARGVAYAEGLGERLERTEVAYLALFRDWAGVSEERVLRFGAALLESVAAWRPHLAREIEGIAHGGGRRPEVIAALNGRTELVAGAECSTIARVSTATHPLPVGTGPWLAQNWDWYLNAPERCVAITAEVDGHRFLTFTEAGVLAKIGINDRGLALTLNILRHVKDAPDPTGTPVHLLLREVLATCATTADVAALLATVRPAASSCFGVVTGAGEAAVFEVSPVGVARIDHDARTGLLGHANHFVDATLATGDAVVERHDNSCARMAGVLAAMPATLAHARAALSDPSGEHPVCRTGEPPRSPELPSTGTAAVLLLDPGAATMEVGMGPGGRDGWTSLRLS